MRNYIVTAFVTLCTVVLGMWVASMFIPHVEGAVSTTNGIDSPYTSVNLLQEWQGTIPFTATSSYVASIKNPFGNATATIEVVAINATNSGFTAAGNIYVATGTTAYSTSSPALAIWPFTSGGAFSYKLVENMATSSAGITGGTGSADILPGVQWSTAGIVGSNYILGPNQFLNVKVATTTGGTFSTYLSGSGVTVKIRKL